jgi:glucose/arabinose dehydrogenase
MSRSSRPASLNSAIKILCLAATVVVGWSASLARADGERGPGVPNFWVRDGYRVTLVAERVAEARFVEFDDKGTLYLSQPREGVIVSLKDTDGDGTFDKQADFITGRKTAHGMHFYAGWMWWTTSGGIYKSRDTNGDGKADETLTVVDKGLPSGGGHWWRTICVDDSGFYTSIGDDGNINEHRKDERCRVWRFNLDGSGKREFAGGLRNTEKLRLRPGTNDLYGADHGSDNYGSRFGERRGLQPVTDLNPPCEFNHYIDGGFYGHPYVVGNKLPRLEFMNRDNIDVIDLADKTIAPAWPLGAHVAPNGWTFTTRDATVPTGDAVIALHGSWNSTKKVGYAVQHVLFDAATGQPYGARPLVVTLSGDGRDVLGRPCDVTEAPDGSLIWTDDHHRKIYRISRSK